MAQLIAAGIICLVMNFRKDDKLIMKWMLARKEVTTNLDDEIEEKRSVLCFKLDEHWIGIGTRPPRKSNAKNNKTNNNKKASATNKKSKNQKKSATAKKAKNNTSKSKKNGKSGPNKNK